MDGLVSQIPALIISVAAGMLVSKAGVDGSANEALGGQLMGSPQGLSMVAGVTLFAGLLPGMPIIPFALLSAGSGYMAWRAWRAGELARVAEERHENEIESAAASEEAKQDAPISDSLAIDELKVELGFGLLPFDQRDRGSQAHRSDQGRAPSDRN